MDETFTIFLQAIQFAAAAWTPEAQQAATTRGQEEFTAPINQPQSEQE